MLLGVAIASVASPGAYAAKTAPRIKPPRLRPGDVIGLIEPATASDEPFDLTLVEEAVRAMGLVPKRAPHLLGRYGYLSGQDKDRAADVNAMFADKSVRGIFAVRGGWGSARLLPYLDYTMIRANPKLLLGYSDITALHMALAAKGCAVTLHGPNGGSAWGKASLDSFKEVAFDAKMPLFQNPPGTEQRLIQRQFRTQTITSGKARGHLLGGNLTVLTALVGTPYLPDFTGAILFIEDVEEAEYRIDRMLTQLGQAGILGKLAGVVFGQCTKCTGSSSGVYGGFTVSAVLQQHLGTLGIPAYQGSFFGHITDQFTLPEGVLAEIDADAGTLQLLEAAVV
jgi:muramoyltetrapeptide carboxypeptidase